MQLLRYGYWRSIRTAFFDPEDKITYTIESKNMEWFRASKKKGIDGGWYVVATSDDDEIE